MRYLVITIYEHLNIKQCITNIYLDLFLKNLKDNLEITLKENNEKWEVLFTVWRYKVKDVQETLDQVKSTKELTPIKQTSALKPRASWMDQSWE